MADNRQEARSAAQDRDSLDTTASEMGSLPDNQEGSHGSPEADEYPVVAGALPGSSAAVQEDLDRAKGLVAMGALSAAQFVARLAAEKLEVMKGV